MPWYIYICPKCAMWYWDDDAKTLNFTCKYCETHMIKTKYTTSSQPREYHLQPWHEKDDPAWEVLKYEYVKGNPLYDPEAERYAFFKKMSEMGNKKHVPVVKNEPKCPTCGSTNICKIGTISKTASIAAFGIFSSNLGKTMKCNKCGHKW